MKKIFFPVLAALFIFASCNDAADTSHSHDSELKQKNIAANEVIAKAFQTGDVSGIDSVVSDDFIDHTDRGDMKGRDSLKAAVKWIHETHKDMKMEKIYEMADDNYVFSWMRYSGTGNGTGGMPNGPFEMVAIEVSKYKDGKAIEHWNFMEAQSLAKMMSPQPKMDVIKKADTTTAKK